MTSDKKGGWVGQKKSQNHYDVILEWSLTYKGYYHRMACQIAVILKIYLHAITERKPIIGAH
jgi:hypothetical protein